MAFTKVTNVGIGSTGTVLLQNLNVTGVGTFGSNVSIGGTLTYEDVTNVDSVGLITARNGIVVGSGITLSKDGDIFATGVTTTGSIVSNGNVDISGSLTIDDSEKLVLGTGSDTSIFFDGTRTALNTGSDTGNEFRILTAAAVRLGKRTDATATHAENMLRALPDGAVELYHNGSKKFETTSSGATLTGTLIAGNIDSTGSITVDDSEKLVLGTGSDLEIYHDGSHSLLKNTTGYLRLMAGGSGVTISNLDNSETMATFVKDGAVELYHNNTNRLQTESNGVRINGILKTSITSGQALTYGDNAQIHLGSGDDLQLYHDGSNSWIKNTTGTLYIQDDSAVILGSVTSAETYVKGVKDGAVELYHNNNKKLATTSTGIQIDDGEIRVKGSSTTGYKIKVGNAATGTDDHLGSISGLWGDNEVAQIGFRSGDDTTNKDDGRLFFATSTSGSNPSTRFSIDQGGICVFDSSTRVDFYGNAKLYDNDILYFGTGNDLTISHNGSNSIIEDNGTGSLYLKTNSHAYFLGGDDSTLLEAVSGGAIKLRYGGVQKFETTTYGVKVAGTNTTSGPTAATLLVQHGGDPLDDKTLLTLQNGDGGSGDITLGNNTHIDFVFKDGNENVTPQARITAHAGDGSDPNSVAKEGRGYLTFHCSSTSNTSGDENPGERLKIAYDGTLTASGTNDISDQRLKENIATISGATAKIKALTGRSFTWKSEADMPAGTHYGFIAQEVEPTIPDIVITHTGIRAFDKDDNLMDDASQLPEGGSYAKSVHTSGVVPVLVEALKEALTKIETLETKVAALESA